MINKEFYPTPVSLLEKIEADFSAMWDGLPDCVSVLEPSAGKGDIIDWLMRRKGSYYYSRKGTLKFRELDVDCIEPDAELRATLKGKKYYVIHDNFLSFDTPKRYDLIIMNPPFSNGDRHLLRAIKLQERYGGTVACILNAETVRNPCTNIRKELVTLLKKYNAQIKYYKDSFAVYDAERRTAVEIAVIVLRVPIPDDVSKSFVFDKLDKGELKQELDFSPEEERAEIVTAGLDYLDSYIKQYQEEVSAGIALLKEYSAYSALRKIRFGGLDKEYDGNPLVLKVNNKDDVGSDSVNGYIKIVRYRYWRALFDNKQFSGKLTSKMYNELYNSVKDMVHYDFTLHNILELLTQIRNKTLSGIEESLMELFHTCSDKYSYIGETSNNIHYYNGWKTNKAHKVNKKVIIPMHGVWDAWRYGGKTEWDLRSYRAIDGLKDLAKALDYIADPVYSNIDTHNNIANQIELNFKRGIAENIDTKYFILTFYKKGTCHITFKDDELLEKFNLYVGLRKAWLPPDYGKKRYSDMDLEERAIVESFSGSEKSYNKIFNNQAKYLVGNEQLLMLGVGGND